MHACYVESKLLIGLYLDGDLVSTDRELRLSWKLLEFLDGREVTLTFGWLSDVWVIRNLSRTSRLKLPTKLSEIPDEAWRENPKKSRVPGPKAEQKFYDGTRKDALPEV